MMKRTFQKLLPVLLATLLLLFCLFLSACSRVHNYDLNEPTDTTATSSPICQHTFTTTVVNEYRDATETHHSCYEVEIRVCINCGFTEKREAFFCTEYHELGEVDYHDKDENGEFIFYGTCAKCNEKGRTTP